MEIRYVCPEKLCTALEGLKAHNHIYAIDEDWEEQSEVDSLFKALTEQDY